MPKRTPTALVIIDMQPEFIASYDVIDSVVRQVKKAKAKRHHIVLVEYRGSGKTHRSIRDAIGRYVHHRVLKNFDNGGPNVVNLFDSEDIEVNRIRACGVNIGACVAETVNHIASEMEDTKIEVIGSACSSDHQCGGRREFYGKNIRIIGKFHPERVRCMGGVAAYVGR